MTNYKEEFINKKYAVVTNAVDRSLIDFITQYALFDEMQDFSPEGFGTQVPLAHSKYADPAMESMLLQLQPLVENVTGLNLFPTYAYHRVYRNGDELKPHTDRPACEISVTLSFNYSYDDSKYTWPIYIDGSPLTMKPGDLAVYRGIELEHWREPFSIDEDAWHVQAFLHYVDVDGPHSEWKFDKRPSIGEKSSKVINQVPVAKSYVTYL